MAPLRALAWRTFRITKTLYWPTVSNQTLKYYHSPLLRFLNSSVRPLTSPLHPPPRLLRALKPPVTDEIARWQEHSLNAGNDALEQEVGERSGVLGIFRGAFHSMILILLLHGRIQVTTCSLDTAKSGDPVMLSFNEEQDASINLSNNEVYSREDTDSEEKGRRMPDRGRDARRHEADNNMEE
ncbi:hypothetical protein CONPUDRAFT_71975 [Coniophora puteana RWD-64-598 SS2]|uniref:Uncharacterized protein n=1 Tax=Coniophora puteana (strain RWD-64-598) TaxID=741705 RepID=A0A5M3MWA4_CONPW|nr:uncharacterized protein CONPUDRAFT_71975 [Coniophora puteana RWD-64-598 SS2]EIW83428.1 hypothetical protein CONPUDRAFT_71975 [Coniophora puteana RWD-64-598 SS2]